MMELMTRKLGIKHQFPESHQVPEVLFCCFSCLRLMLVSKSDLFFLIHGLQDIIGLLTQPKAYV